MDAYRKHIREFRRKFGREMGPDDPFFFDPNRPSPEFRNPEEAQFAIDLLAELMGDAGIHAETIYAFKATGGLYPSQNCGFSSDQEAEWNAAIREYHAKLHRAVIQ
jgi:hypothetical protein